MGPARGGMKGGPEGWRGGVCRLGLGGCGPLVAQPEGAGHGGSCYCLTLGKTQREEREAAFVGPFNVGKVCKGNSSETPNLES